MDAEWHVHEQPTAAETVHLADLGGRHSRKLHGAGWARSRFGWQAVVMADPDSAELPLPPVERVRPGLWSIPVPIPNNPLRYVLVYAFETDRGPYLIDAGWNTDDAYHTLVAGFDQAGFAIGDVKGVLVTHIHPDHYGLAGRDPRGVRGLGGADPADARLVESRYDEPDELLGQMATMLRRDGTPPEEVISLQQASMPVRSFVWAATPDVLVEDGDIVEVPGWDLKAIWTPGHSPGHLCFYQSSYRLMLSGDHVLPRITPNISFHPQAGPDPLGDFWARWTKWRPMTWTRFCPPTSTVSSTSRPGSMS